MVVLRLARRGNRHRPFYHIVAADRRYPRDGRFLELVGHYDPLGDTGLKVDQEIANKWLDRGAQMSPTVKRLLKRAALDAVVASANA